MVYVLFWGFFLFRVFWWAYVAYFDSNTVFSHFFVHTHTDTHAACSVLNLNKICALRYQWWAITMCLTSWPKPAAAARPGTVRPTAGRAPPPIRRATATWTMCRRCRCTVATRPRTTNRPRRIHRRIASIRSRIGRVARNEESRTTRSATTQVRDCVRWVFALCKPTHTHCVALASVCLCVIFLQ